MAQKTVSVRLSVEADNLDGIRKKLEELGATVKTVGNDNSADKLRRSLEGLEGRLDPAARAAQRLARDTETLNKSLAEGAVSQKRYNDLMAKSQAAYAQATSGATGQSKALADLHGATKMSYESQQILRSGLINTFQSISAGLPIGQTLLTQTTQTAPAFVEMAKGASLSTAALVGFAVPTLAAAAAAGLVAARLASISSEAKQLAAITTALNPNLGATAEQLRAISFAVADQGTSRATGMAALTAVIRDTRIQSAGLAEQIAKVSVDVAAVMGGEVPDWAKKIGEAAATGSQGFDKLLSTLPGITAETMKAVRTEEQRGNRLGASKIAVDALEKQFNGSAKAMKGSWDSAVHDMTTAWDVFMERVATSDFSNTVARGFGVMGKAIANALRSPTISEEIVGLNRKLVGAQDELERLRGLQSSSVGLVGNPIAEQEARVKDLESRVNVLIDKARTEARMAEDAQAAAGTGKIGGLTEDDKNKLNLATDATGRQAAASALLAGALSVQARATAENRIALADMAMQYPALGAGTAKAILSSKDFASTLATLPPELKSVYEQMQNNAANKLAGDVAQAGVALSSAAYAAKMHAEAAGMGEAAMRAASIEAEVYAHRMDGTADAVRASLDEQERYVRAGIQQEFEQGINRQIEANDRLIAAYGVSGKAVEDASRYNEAYLQTLKEYPESMKNLPAYEDLWTTALNRNIDKLKERDLSKLTKDIKAYSEKLRAAQEDLNIDRAAAGMSDLAALDLKARYDALKAMGLTIEKYGTLNDAVRQQVNTQLDAAASIAQQQQEVKNYADAWGVALGSAEKGMEKVGDAAVQIAVEGKSAAIEFGSLWKGVFASITSDVARLGMVDVKRLLGLGGNTQGSLLDLFGGSFAQSGLAGKAANQNGGLSSFTNGSFGLSNLSGGWLDRQLGGGLTDISGFLSSPITGNSAQMFGGGFDTALAAQNASPLGTLSWGQGIGGAAGLVSGGMQIANGNVIGGGGQMIGSALTLAGMPEIGIPIQIASSLLGGLFGKDRGKPAAAGSVTVDKRGNVVNSAAATDNEGNQQQADQLRDSLAKATQAFTAAVGGLRGDMAISVEAKDGQYRPRLNGELTGSYSTLDEAVIASFRHNISGGLIDASKEVLQAVSASASTDINEFLKDVALGKAIGDATAGLQSLDTSLAGIGGRAKEAAAASYATAIEEKKRADGLGLGAEYAAVVERQIRSSWDNAASAWTPLQTALAEADGKAAALKDTIKAMGPAISDAEVDAAKAAEVARLRQQAVAGWTRDNREARGVGALSGIEDLVASFNVQLRDAAALGEGDALIRDSFGRRVNALLSGLAPDQLDAVQRELSGAGVTLTGASADMTRAILNVARGLSTATAAAQAQAAQQALVERNRSLRGVGAVNDVEAAATQYRADQAVDPRLAADTFDRALRDIFAKLDTGALQAVIAELSGAGVTLAGTGTDMTAAILGVARSASDAADALAAQKAAADAAAAATQAAAQVEQQRAGLQSQIWQLTGDTAAIRNAELAALDPANRALQERIYALTDEASATEKANQLAQQRAGLQNQIWQLEGNTAAIRGAELDALDASLRPLQERIYALTDEKEAADKARQAADEMRSSWSGLADSLASYKKSLLLSDYSPLDPAGKFAEAQAQFRDILGKAQGGDTKAAEQLQGASDAYLKANQDYWASANPAAFQEVQAGLTDVETVAQKQVRLAESQIARLDGINTSVQGVTAAVGTVTAAVGSAASTLSAAFQAAQQAAVAQAAANGVPTGSVGGVNTTTSNYNGLMSSIPAGLTGLQQLVISNALLQDDKATSARTGQDRSADIAAGLQKVQGLAAALPSPATVTDEQRSWLRQLVVSLSQSGLTGLPGYAVGTDSAPPGMAWVGEHGRELIQMAGGERVYPHHESEAIARAWSGAPANDRWAHVTEFRTHSPPASGGGGGAMAALIAQNAELIREIRQLRAERARDARGQAALVEESIAENVAGHERTTAALRRQKDKERAA